MKALPLRGIRVADLTAFWAGPYATRLLAEMGAEVIKVESPRAWDNIRTFVAQPGAPEPWNSSYYFNEYNRDKRSLTLDLADAEGRERFLTLITVSDVVIENYRADVLDNLSLGYDVLRSVRPDIVLVSMAGFGKTGAERDFVGFGPIIEQMAGLASLTGYGDDGEPYKTGVSYGDPVAGAAAVGAVAMALIQRHRTGEGTWIDLAQRELVSTLIGEAFVAASLRGAPPAHRGNRNRRIVPQGVYRCAGEQEWLALSVRNDGEWRALAGLIGAGALAGLDLDQRWQRHDEIDAQIQSWTSARDGQSAMRTLQEAGVPAGRVLNVQQVYEDPHLNERGAWVELDHPLMHRYKQSAAPWHFQEAAPRPRRHAPFFGEHNAEILNGLLGADPATTERLRERGTIGTAPVNPTSG